ncbi:uncharacterized protein LOC112575439 isoform X2 [Pomacea canaliculata]|uniref:uncharacterized protein LOC112575439 isoform X2 n=1 Tax=Pomacea canaliculata TaxID=400727 RepID=UPI000D731BFF|nr:uncharacterized protein LOC112575439 isoform X2 [Pomacea canaliculata]
MNNCICFPESHRLSDKLSSHHLLLSPVTMMFIVFLSYLPLAFVLAQDDQITCSIPPVELYQDTALTCYFPEDLNVTKKDFSIYHFSTNTKPDAVIDCWWMNGTLNCVINGGYKYNKTVNTQLTVTLSHVSKAQSGTYACQVAGYRPSSFGTCQLEIKQVDREGRIACSIPMVQPGEDVVLTCHYPEDLSVTKKDFSVYHYTKGINPEAVLDCWWMTGKLKCIVNPGYKYNEIVNSQLDLNISHVMSVNKGTYSCQIAGYKPSLFGTCQLESGQSKRDKKIECFMPHVQTGEDVSLTCRFPEELSVARKEFSVYHVTEDAKQNAVVDCWWSRDKLKCITNSGYEYNKTDDTTLTVTIRHVTASHAGVYVCDLAGYSSSSFGMCHLQISHDIKEPVIKTSLVIGLTCAFVAVAVVVTVLVIFFRKKLLKNFMRGKRRYRSKREDETQSKEELSLIATNHKSIKVEFQEFMLKNVREMFRDMLNGCYFVPPIYFNKTRYKTETVAGQVVYIPDPPDPSDVLYNQVMQKALLCLRRIVKTKQQRMFVLTNFNYDDYLNNPGHNFITHGLPVPAGLKKQEGDNEIGCFDFLIIHRQYGVVVGVVKTVSDKNETDHLMVTEVSEAILQLTKASRMIKHLMSDQNRPLKVRQTLLLPNIESTTLNRVLHKHPDLTQKLRKCFQTKDTPVHLCLCADSVVMTWWDSLMTKSTDDYIMKDDLYECMIARFCGPATTSAVDIPRTPDGLQLPKTLDQAVSVTGDLFDRCTLYPGMTDFMQEPRVFLSGPPGTGKTRLLGLVGQKWLSEGHVVHIVNTSTKLTSATIQLVKILQEAQSSCISQNDVVVILNCNTERRKDIREMVTELKANAGEKPVCVLADDLEINADKSKEIQEFFERLLVCLPDINCWASSCSSKYAPGGWRSEVLTVPISCPPAVLREAMKEERIPCIPPYTARKFTPPTEGMPVRLSLHTFCVSSEEINYKNCGTKIVNFLSEALRISGIDANPGEMAMDVLSPEHQRQYRQPTALQYRDILILFEDDVKQFMPVVTACKESGIPVQIIDHKSQEVVLNSNVVVATNAGFLCGIKRKVVIYVQGNTEPSDIFATWNKLRSITSCTSQLVLFVNPFVNFMNNIVTAAEQMFSNLFSPI